MKPLLVFDMDGVLVDVSGSYRAAIMATIHFFTGQTVTPETIQDWKNRGGYNNDWVLCHHYCREAGVELEYATVVDRFNGFFFGENNDGLALQERWIPSNGLLERLSARYQLALFTGRDRRELAFTLGRHPGVEFAPQVTAEAVDNGKPAPDGLRLIAQKHPGAKMVYVGDTVDDASSAKAAGVPFIGITAADSPRRAEVIAALRGLGAIAVIENINEIEGVLPA
jgi:HAD superfamily phosphatase